MTQKSFQDLVILQYQDEDPNVNCRSVTFQVTDNCCLNCSYCYQINKGNNIMTKQTAKDIVDLLFKMYDENDENNFINHHTKGIILDFIGGEPFMNIDTIEYTTKYFFDKCLELQHIWLMNTLIQISTNGILYFDEKVQHFINSYKEMIGMTITLDGPKKLHDACRVDYDGKGSFDKVIKAWRHWKNFIGEENITTKVTIAPENLFELNTIFDFFLSEKVQNIYANPIYEHKWTIEESKIYYKQLIELANKLLENDIAYSSLFDLQKARPMPTDKENNKNWCGGTGLMLSFDPNGIAYPCIRYMPSSLGKDIEPIIIGNKNGLYKTEKEKQNKIMLSNITRISQSSEECINCQVASGCGWCSAYNYQENRTPNKRSTNICWMHRAEALAGVYYWNIFYRKYNLEKRFPLYLQRDIALKIIDDNEYNKLLMLSF